VSVFRVWAPAAGAVEVQVRLAGQADGAEKVLPMRRDGPPGWWEASVPGAADGADYGFQLDGGPPLADPRSPRQPYGSDGLSRSYDHAAFGWTDQGWRGGPLRGAVIYELHVGTFTPDGTFDAAIAHLDHLSELGVDMIELMPVAGFPGRWGWGYDGIHLWTVHEAYGGPDGLKRFVDACHARRLGVLMDVRDTFHAELVADLDVAATDLGYDLVLSTLTPARDERRAAEILLDFRCEALILLGPDDPAGRLNALGRELPVVVIGRRIPGPAMDVVRGGLAGRHPELSREAVEALVWEFSYAYK